jgi:hypothetical protein
MSRITRITVATLAAVAVAAPVAGASTQDLRSPDTRDAAVTQVVQGTDLRSPDTRDAGLPAPAPVIDLRSPDGRDAATPPSSQPAADPPSDGFAWGYLIVGSAALVLLTAGGLTTRSRRAKHSVPAS